MNLTTKLDFEVSHAIMSTRRRNKRHIQQSFIISAPLNRCGLIQAQYLTTQSKSNESFLTESCKQNHSRLPPTYLSTDFHYRHFLCKIANRTTRSLLQIGPVQANEGSTRQEQLPVPWWSVDASVHLPVPLRTLVTMLDSRGHRLHGEGSGRGCFWGGMDQTSTSRQI